MNYLNLCIKKTAESFLIKIKQHAYKKELEGGICAFQFIGDDKGERSG